MEAALYYKRWDPDVIRFLFSNGSKVTRADGNSNLFHLVATTSLVGMPDLIRDVCNKEDTMAPDESFVSPVLRAVQSRNLDVLKAFVDVGADVHGEYAQGWTLLMHACLVPDGNDHIIRYLLDLGVDMNEVNSFGGTAAECTTNLEYIDILLESGLRLAPSHKMIGNRVLQRILDRAADDRNEVYYSAIKARAEKERPSLYIPPYSEHGRGDQYTERNVARYMGGDTTIPLNVMEQRTVIIRKTEHALVALGFATTPHEITDVVERIKEELVSLTSQVYQENFLFLCKAAYELLSVTDEYGYLDVRGFQDLAALVGDPASLDAIVFRE